MLKLVPCHPILACSTKVTTRETARKWESLLWVLLMKQHVLVERKDVICFVLAVRSWTLKFFLLCMHLLLVQTKLTFLADKTLGRKDVGDKIYNKTILTGLSNSHSRASFAYVLLGRLQIFLRTHIYRICSVPLGYERG